VLIICLIFLLPNEFNISMKFDYDLIILGSGPAGFSAAMQATKFEKKVLLVEANEKHLGGSWINTGTVPSKALREAAATIHKHTELFGDIDGKKAWARFKMADLLRFKNRVVDYENSEVKRNLIKNEVHTARGFGKITDEHTIEVTDHLGNVKSYTSEFILISTGSTQQPPATFKIDHEVIIDSYAIMNMTHIPRRLAIIGTGINAIEYATIFAALGTKVTLLNPSPQHMPFLDDEIRTEFYKSLEKHRMVIYNNVKMQGVQQNLLRNRTEVRFKLDGIDQLHVIETEYVLHFGARKPNTQKIGLDTVGITVDDAGYINVNDNYQTNVPNIYAAGDVVGFPGLASASFTQGRVATCHMCGVGDVMLTGFHPFGIYSIPEISSIGLTEEEARTSGLDVTVGRAYYKELTKSSVSNNATGMLKLVFETETLKLVGVHIVGENACELIHIGQVLMKKGHDIRYFIDNILNYPTFSEAYRVATFNGVNRVNKAGVKYRSLLNVEKK
jgi:NAD(P) transhydrogenase